MFKAKIITMYYGVYYACRSKMYGNKCLKDPEGETEAYYCKVLRFYITRYIMIGEWTVLLKMRMVNLVPHPTKK